MRTFGIMIMAGLAMNAFAQTTCRQMQLRRLIPDERILVGATVNQWLVAADLDKAEHKQNGSYKLVGNAEQMNIEMKLVPKEFNCVTAENCMKSEVINPREGVFDFVLADQFVEFAEKHDMVVIGHSPIWHSQIARWICRDKAGHLVSKETLKQRIRDHIYTVYGHYKGRVRGWDVCNEAFEDNGTYRKSDLYNIMGEEWIDWAFQCAMEADPNAELYYNDYSMAIPAKRDAVVTLIRRLKSKGIRIDAVGLQTHIDLGFPDFKEYENSIKAFIAEGVDVQLTETDISILPNPYAGADVATRFQYSPEKDPYKNGVPKKEMAQWQKRYEALFAIVNKYADHVKRVTFWGVTDASSWKNDFPIHGRTDYPLPFGRDGEFKL